MEAYLEQLAAAIDRVDISPLGISRDRLKRESSDVLDALSAAAALSCGSSGWERVVSERMFSDSKRLGAIRGTVAEILLRADPRWEGIGSEDSLDVLEAYGVRRKPGLIQCAGAAVLEVGGAHYRLEDFAPSAHLPDAWADAWVKGVIAAGPRWITTIENEFPFLSYVIDAGSPARLGARGEIVVYTAGFPSTALLSALTRIAGEASSTLFRHWGDADVGGLRIWWLLRSRLGREVELFRTRRAWLEAEAGRGRELTDRERRGLAALREELACSSASSASDVADALDLIDGLINIGRKIEQERW
jgi:hypothetical protein